MALLEVHLPDGRIVRLELNKSNMTLGRSPQADLRIDDPEISRLHARLDKTAQNRWTVTDLESKNETYFQGRAVKSHMLTHMDTFYFGSIQVIFLDPSGAGDKKINMTIYKTAQGLTPVEKKYACPLCKADMSTTDIVCTRCGYNMRTGEALKVEVEEEDDDQTPDENKDLIDLGFDTQDSNGSTTTSSVSPRPQRKSDSESVPAKPIFVNKRWQLFIDWWLPIGIFALSVLLILLTQKPIDAGITLLSIIFRIVLMLFSLALATKVANFPLGCFLDALVKILAITSTIALFEWPGNPAFGIVTSLVILVGLIKLFFNPDLFGWMLASLIMFILNTFLISNFMLPQLRTLFQ